MPIRQQSAVKEAGRSGQKACPTHYDMIEHDILSAFPKQKLEESLLSAWKARATHFGYEPQEAYELWHPYAWWEVPIDRIISGFAGLGFLPDEVFSYYLPGCMLKALAAPDGHETYEAIFYRIGPTSYRYDRLYQPQLACVKRFILHANGLPAMQHNGSLNIAEGKLADRLKNSDCVP